jgi:hypothetical protein
MDADLAVLLTRQLNLNNRLYKAYNYKNESLTKKCMKDEKKENEQKEKWTERKMNRKKSEQKEIEQKEKSTFF